MHDSAKYLIHAAFAADGIVERSDVVGAIYGQTEGLLGEELDLRRLQESSKLGRIDVEVETSSGQSVGNITISTSLDRVETATLAAALETIDRVGPCRATIEVTDLEDVRAAKRRDVIERAERLLLEEFEETTSDAIVEKVRRRVATADATTYEGLPAGPRVDDADAIVVVEGRSDVQTVLAAGVKNAIAVEGTDVPDAVASLTADRTTTAFLDGDRGGELILRELCQVGDVDYVAFAPGGQSVEDLSRTAVHDALRNKVSVEAVDDAATARDLAEAARAAATNVTGDEGSTVDDGAAAAEGALGESADGDARPDDAGAGRPESAPAASTDSSLRQSDDGGTERETPERDAAKRDVAEHDATGQVAAESEEHVEGTASVENVPAEASESSERTHTDGGTGVAPPGDAGGNPADSPSPSAAESDRLEQAPDATPAADGDATDTAPNARSASAPGDETTSDEEVSEAAGGDATPTAGDEAAAPSDDADASSEPDRPRTIHGHVAAVRDTGRVRMLDADRCELEEAPIEDAFGVLEAMAEPPATIVLDDVLEQRLLDLAAQRGVREIVAASLGSFTKRPVDVRVRTMDDLQPT